MASDTASVTTSSKTRPPTATADVVAYVRKELDIHDEHLARITTANSGDIPRDAHSGVTLDLSHKNIRELSVEVIALIKDKVERLALSHNLQIAVPSQIVQCDRLRYLNLRWNSLKYFPEAILQLSKLEILDISKNRITAIPEGIKGMSSLKFLAVARNKITRLPLSLGEMASLSKLKLDENPIEFPPWEVLKLAKDKAGSSETEKEKDNCAQIKQYLKQAALRERPMSYSDHETSESNVETPRPPKRGIGMGGQFPVRPSLNGIENVTDFKDESPSDNAPPVAKRSHARVSSGTLDLQLQRPGVAPLPQSSSEANRSRSDTVSSLSSIRARRQGYVPSKKTVSSNNTSRDMSAVNYFAGQGSARSSQATIKAPDSRSTSVASIYNGYLATNEIDNTVVDDSDGSRPTTLHHETLADDNRDFDAGGRDYNLSQLSNTRRHGGQAVMIDTASSINPATSSFVDSGYGSKSSASSKQRVGSHKDDSDNRSIRTDGRLNDIPSYFKAILVSQFVGRLVFDTKKYMINQVLAGNIEDLLRDYAKLLEKSAGNEIERRAVTFVRHQRPDIATNFEGLVQAWQQLGSSTEISSEERMGMLFHGDPTGPADFNRETQLNAQSLQPSEGSDWGLRGNEALVPEDVPQARDFLLEGSDFRWLTGRIKMLTTRTQTGSSYSDMRKEITSLTCSLPPGGELKLTLEWHPKRFLAFEYKDLHHDLRTTVVYCGSASNSYATTVSHYLAMTWPTVGRATIDCVQRALFDHSDVAKTEIAGATLEIVVQAKNVSVTLTGHAQSVIEIAESCIWLTVACRASETDEAVAYSIPSLIAADLTSFPTAQVTVRANTKAITAEEGPGLCWLGMLRNPVIAAGYPIPLRPEAQHCAGLEASLELLMALSQSQYATTFGGVFLFKGSISALVPVWETATSVLWHLLINHSGKRMSYNEACSIGIETTMTPANIGDLKDRRHFVGLWTTDGQVCAGSRRDRLYNLRQSVSMPIDHPTLTWTGLSISGGKFLTVGTTFTLGRKDATMAFATAGEPYDFAIGRASGMTVLFYGQADQRAWLIDGASTLTHLSRAWMSSELAANQNADVLEKIQYVGANGGKNEAVRVLRANRDIPIFLTKESKLELSQSEEFSQEVNSESSDSAYVSGSNGSSRKMTEGHKTVTSEWTYMSLVLHFWHLLESMMDKLAKDGSTAPQLSVKTPKLKPLLNGWEASDIVRYRTKKESMGHFHLRAIKLKPDATQWLKLTQEIGSVVLLAKTFGDLIRPQQESKACLRTSRLPEGRDLLAVPLYMWQLMPDAERYISSEDDHSCGFVQITDYIFWHSFGPFPLRCQCSTFTRCQFISNLSSKVPHLPRSYSKSPRLNLFERYPQSVAVIGGANALKKRRKPSAFPSASNNETATDDSDSLYHSLSESDSMDRPSTGEVSNANPSTFTEHNDPHETFIGGDDTFQETSRGQVAITSAEHDLVEHSSSPVPTATSVRSRFKKWRERLGANRTS